MRMSTQPMSAAHVLTGAPLSSLVVGIIAFLTVVDLFATQAILPSLAHAYGVMPAAMGLAVNASTFGMAVASLAVAFFSPVLDRRRGILASLLLLSMPTLLLAFAPNIAVFAALRVAQGLCMATAFTLTLAWLGEHSSGRATASAFAAYITGNVASNLVGRLVSAGLADHFGLAANFIGFAALNLAGAALVYFTIKRAAPMPPRMMSAGRPLRSLVGHLRNGALAAGFGIGFCILFAFIGTFTFVNFVLTRPPHSVGMMTLGFVYFVFLPSVFTTPLAGAAVARIGTRASLWASLALAGLGLPLLLAESLWPVIAGIVLVAVGTFFAQAVATGFIGRAATSERGSASGIYLASYFSGGLLGTAILGRVFDSYGWPACVAGIGIALALAALLTFRLKLPGE
jgi:MFS transporter, YNFM family, putative membrane transport protein